QGVLPDDQRSEQLRFLADVQVAEGLGRGVDAHTGAVEIDDGRGETDVCHGSAEKTDQDPAPEVLPRACCAAGYPNISTNTLARATDNYRARRAFASASAQARW